MLGVIAGTNLRDSMILSELKERLVETPYGKRVCYVGDDMVLLLRHEPAHAVPPHRINHKANITTLVNMGADEVVSINSCGSLRGEVMVKSFVVPHDFVALCEYTTFFDDDVYHVTPEINEGLRKRLTQAAKMCGERVYEQGVYVHVRGPRLETVSEVNILRTFGDVVGMTLAPEVMLCCELGLPTASLCSVDNYANGVVGKITMEEIFESAAASMQSVEHIIERLVATSVG